MQGSAEDSGALVAYGVVLRTSHKPRQLQFCVTRGAVQALCQPSALIGPCMPSRKQKRQESKKQQSKGSARQTDQRTIQTDQRQEGKWVQQRGGRSCLGGGPGVGLGGLEVCRAACELHLEVEVWRWWEVVPECCARCRLYPQTVTATNERNNE